MPPTTIQPGHYNLIVNRIRDGRCVPFLGAGVNISSGDYKGLPLAYDVALHMVRALTNLNQTQLETLTKKAEEDVRLRVAQAIANLDEDQIHNLTEEHIEQYLSQAGPLPSLLRASLPDLARIALHVEVETDFDYLMALIHEVIPDTDYQPSPLLQMLASLPFKLIVTTNYDRLLERAFANKPYELVVQPISGFSQEDQVQLWERLSAPKGPIIYKIHGSFHDNGDLSDQSNGRHRLILTEEDYIQFLSVVGQEGMGVPTLVSEKMVKGTILFLGYSLQDWDFRTIYKSLIEPLPEKDRPKSFAIQKNPPDFWVRYWESKKVTIFDVDLYQFTTNLQTYWQNEVEE